MKILIIDDEKFLVENLARYLQQRIPAKIHFVNQAEDAMELVAKEEFDLIICDLKISDQSEGELILHITKKLPNQKFIVISAQELPQNLSHEKKENIEAYFEKPFDIAEIEKTINSIYQRLEKHGTVEVRKEARKEI